MNGFIANASGSEIVNEAEAVIDAVASGNVSSSLLSDFGRLLLGYLPTVIAAVIIYIVGMIVKKIILKIIDKAMGHSRIDDVAKGFLNSLLGIVLSAFVIVIALSSLGIPMTSIITVIGAASVAIGLALQNSLSNVAGGFIILFTKPFGKGDYIITNGIEGVVDNISILSTKLVTLDNKVIFVPNGMVSSNPITNFSKEAKRRVDLEFNISYDADFNAAIKLILKIINSHELVLKEDEVFARLSSLSESSVVITVRVWTKTENYWNVYFDLIEKIKSGLTENGFEIPYSKLDVNIRNQM